MKRVTIRVIGTIGAKLQFVKKMKEHTEWGLKDAKDVCDKLIADSHLAMDIEVNDADEFKYERNR